MAYLTVKCDPSKVSAELSEFQKKVIRNLLDTVNKYSKIGAENLKSEHMSGSGPTSVDDKTGKLKRSVRIIPANLSSTGIHGGVTVGDSTTPYAKVLISTPRGKESTLTPKSPNRFLAIPLPYARTGKGVPRGRARDPIWGLTFVMQGMIWGYQRGTSREYSGATPLFALKGSVVVKSRIDLREDVLKKIQPMINKESQRIISTLAGK